MISDTLKKRAFRLSDVKASALTGSQINDSHSFACDSVFNCVNMTVGKNDISRVRDKRTNVTSPTWGCTSRYGIVKISGHVMAGYQAVPSGGSPSVRNQGLGFNIFLNSIVCSE